MVEQEEIIEEICQKCGEKFRAKWKGQAYDWQCWKQSQEDKLDREAYLSDNKENQKTLPKATIDNKINISFSFECGVCKYKGSLFDNDIVKHIESHLN